MYMTTDPEQIADWYCDFVVIGKFLGNTDTFVANGDHIYTKGLFEVTDVLKLSLIHISRHACRAQGPAGRGAHLLDGVYH